MTILSKTPLYMVWVQMRQRCTNPKNKRFAEYGGRGIEVCQRWERSFPAFLSDVGDRPEGMTLDRIDNNKGYYPENCKWSTRAEQQRNTRRTRLLTHAGRSMTKRDWEVELGLSVGALHHRLVSGWPLDLALTTRGTK